MEEEEDEAKDVADAAGPRSRVDFSSFRCPGRSCCACIVAMASEHVRGNGLLPDQCRRTDLMASFHAGDSSAEAHLQCGLRRRQWRSRRRRPKM